MEDRRYVLNKKAFAATRVMGKDSKWAYIHVSPKGVICTDARALIRITLPCTPKSEMPTSARVFTKAMIENLRPKTADDLVTLPEGLEAKSNGCFTVPDFTVGIPDANKQHASIAIDAKMLINLLKAACEVSDHSRNLVRLRLCGTKPPVLRIDAHRDEGGQEFTGVLMGITYNGACIPGDAIEDSHQHKSEDVDQKKLTLPLLEGRKFRK
jgi:hypothetical protein